MQASGFWGSGFPVPVDPLSPFFVVRTPYVPYTRTQSRPLFAFLGFRFPYKVLETKKGTLFIPRFLLGLVHHYPIPEREPVLCFGYWGAAAL